MKLVYSAPINSLSLGNVSFNILRELFKKNVETVLLPIGNNLDFSAYTNLEKSFIDWIKNSCENPLRKIKRETPTLKVWHINGSELKPTDKQFLYTFYEANQPTADELNIAKLQEKTIFSSRYASVHFQNLGVKTTNIPLGFDSDFHETNKTYLGDNIIHFGLMGKWEKRKHTQKIIETWIKKYGNNPRYRLTCCVNNPFFKIEQMNALIGQTVKGQKPFNVNFLPYLKTNAEVNDFLNAIDIDLTGLSGAEGWNLPAFNAVCLGKWSVVLNATSHQDWANSNNSILVEASGMEPIYDNVFFKQGEPFNQGNFFTWTEEDVLAAFEKAESLAKTPNLEGKELGKIFTYEKTVESILEKIQNY